MNLYGNLINTAIGQTTKTKSSALPISRDMVIAVTIQGTTFTLGLIVAAVTNWCNTGKWF